MQDGCKDASKTQRGLRQDRLRKAMAVVPSSPTTDHDRSLAKMWRVHPNQLDWEGKDTPGSASPKLGRAKYTLADIRMRRPDAHGVEREGPSVNFPITSQAWLTKRGRRALEAAVKRGEVIQFENYHFPRVFPKGGYAIKTGDPNQKPYEELRSLLEGSWTAGVPNSSAKIAEEKLLAMGREDAHELAPALVSAANRYQREHFIGTHSAATAHQEFEHMTGLVEMGLHGESEKLARLGWGPGWSGVIDSRTGLAKSVEKPLAAGQADMPVTKSGMIDEILGLEKAAGLPPRDERNLKWLRSRTSQNLQGFLANRRGRWQELTKEG